MTETRGSLIRVIFFIVGCDLNLLVVVVVVVVVSYVIWYGLLLMVRWFSTLLDLCGLLYRGRVGKDLCVNLEWLQGTKSMVNVGHHGYSVAWLPFGSWIPPC